MLVGHYTRLRVMDSSDANYVRLLRNSPHVTKSFQDRFYISDVQQEGFLRQLAESKSRFFFIAETLEPSSPFGVYSIQGIDYHNQRGEAGVFLDEKGLGRGVIVFEAAYLLYDYVFRYLNLQKLCAEVLADNERAIRLNEAVGFQREGVLRRHVFYDGAFHDVFQYAMFREDFLTKPTKFLQQFQKMIGEPVVDPSSDLRRDQ